MRPCDPPAPTYAFGYRRAPRSGNAINGLGEAERSRARQVFHNAGSEPMPWQALDDFFSLINPWSVVRHMLANTWQLRRQTGPVGATQRLFRDPATATAEIKAIAVELGAS